MGGKATRVTSEAARAAAEKRALTAPLVVKGISKGDLQMITPQMFKRLDIDPHYQRGETVMVNRIIRALQAGGLVLDPPTLCQRKGTGDKLWIVDGHQRVCAFQAMGMGFTALVHQSESVEAESSFFAALNARLAVGPNVIVKGWPGPFAVMLRRANESLEHPLHERINFSHGKNESRLGAALITTGCMRLLGAEHSLTAQAMLSRLDMAMSHPDVKVQMEQFLRLLGRVCPKGKLPGLVINALALVARERWAKGVVIPPLKTVEKLRSMNWAAETPLVSKFRSVLLDLVSKVWKAK